VKKMIAAMLFAGTVAFGGVSQAAAAPACVPASVVATDFVVNGAVDFSAYLAAVAAANALCVQLPATGGDTQVLLQIGMGLVAVGAAMAGTVAVRRRRPLAV